MLLVLCSDEQTCVPMGGACNSVMLWVGSSEAEIKGELGTVQK